MNRRGDSTALSHDALVAEGELPGAPCAKPGVDDYIFSALKENTYVEYVAIGGGGGGAPSYTFKMYHDTATFLASGWTFGLAFIDGSVQDDMTLDLSLYGAMELGSSPAEWVGEHFCAIENCPGLDMDYNLSVYNSMDAFGTSMFYFTWDDGYYEFIPTSVCIHTFEPGRIAGWVRMAFAGTDYDGWFPDSVWYAFQAVDGAILARADYSYSDWRYSTYVKAWDILYGSGLTESDIWPEYATTPDSGD